MILPSRFQVVCLIFVELYLYRYLPSATRVGWNQSLGNFTFPPIGVAVFPDSVVHNGVAYTRSEEDTD